MAHFACTLPKGWRLALLPAVAGLLLNTAPAEAVVDVVDVSGMSIADLTPAESTKATIYGGVVGPIPEPAGFDVVDSCAAAGAGVPLACNKRRIHANTRLKIRFTPKEKSGLPRLCLTADTNSEEPECVPAAETVTETGQGSTGEIIVTWGAICAVLASESNSIGSDCEPTTAADVGPAKHQFKVGVSADALKDSDLSDSEDESSPIQIVVSWNVGADNNGLSVGANCDDRTSVKGICHFEVAPGDEKVSLLEQSLIGKVSFPNSDPLNIRAVRLLWAEGEDSSLVGASSPSADLTVNATDQSNVQISPQRVDGFTNDTTYVFKTAVVDLAGNTGYYTNTTDQEYCRTEYNAKKTSRCHIATPGEVVGVLSNQVNCFIATAAYGSIMAPQVETFRKFRNAFLLTNDLGRSFVRFYYEHSPKYAAIIAKSPVLRAASRVALWPVLSFAWLSLNLGTGWAALIFALGFVSIGLAVRALAAGAKKGARA